MFEVTMLPCLFLGASLLAPLGVPAENSDLATENLPGRNVLSGSTINAKNNSPAEDVVDLGLHGIQFSADTPAQAEAEPEQTPVAAYPKVKSTSPTGATPAGTEGGKEADTGESATKEP